MTQRVLTNVVMDVRSRVWGSAVIHVELDALQHALQFARIIVVLAAHHALALASVTVLVALVVARAVMGGVRQLVL